VVSHDRAFLERTVTDVLVLGGDGTAGRRPGGLAAWEAERRRRVVAGGRVAPSVSPAGADARRGGGGTGSGGGARASSPGSSGRSPSTLRHLMKEADKELARLAREAARLDEAVAEAAAAGDHEALARLGAEVAAVHARQAEVEERWLELGAELESR